MQRRLWSKQMRREVMSIAGVGLALVVGLRFGVAPGLAQDLGDCGHPAPGRSIPACSALIQSSGAASDKVTEWLLLRGLSHLAHRDSDAAIADLDQVIRSTTSNAAAYVARGDAYRIKGQPERGVADYEQAIRVDPNHLEAWLALRVDTDPSWYEKDPSRYEKVPSWYLKVLEKFGWESMRRAFMRRETLRANKDFVEGMFLMADEAIRNNSADADAYVRRGNAFMSFGERQFARAMADYNSAIGVDPGNIFAYRERAGLHVLQRNWDLAIADADRILSLRKDTDHPNTLGHSMHASAIRGTAYSEKGDHHRSIAEFDQAIVLAGGFRPPFDHGWLCYWRGRSHERSGDREKAIADYLIADYRKFQPGPWHWRIAPARLALKRLGATDRGPKDGHMAYLDPNDQVHYLSRCHLYLEKRDYDRALADCDHAVRLAPGYYNAYSSRGRVHLAKGDLDAALADFDRAVSLVPKGAMLYADRGLAYERKGERDKAITDYRRAIELNQPWIRELTRRNPRYVPEPDSPYGRGIEGLKRLGAPLPDRAPN